jgi:hypothetical protein
MIEKYGLRNEPDKTMFVFAKHDKFYGHIVKNKTAKAAAKFIFETASFDTIEALKAEYPEQVTAG